MLLIFYSNNQTLIEVWLDFAPNFACISSGISDDLGKKAYTDLRNGTGKIHERQDGLRFARTDFFKQNS
jgi:hypothetical protein